MKRSIRHSLRAAVILLVLAGVGLPPTLLNTQPSLAQDGDDEIIVVGSLVMEDLITDMAQSYQNNTENELTLRIEAQGVDVAGFGRFCDGGADVMMATREISDEEIEACNTNGVEFVEVLVALDALVLAVSEETSVSCVASERLPNVFLPNTQPTWVDLDPNFIPPVSEDAEGDDDTTLTLYGPSTVQSERVLSIMSALLEPDAPRDDYEKFDDLAAILDPLRDAANNGLAFMTLAQWETLEDTSGVRLLEFNTLSTFECVAPSLGTLSTGDYPAMRSLILYVNAVSLLDGNLSDFLQYSVGDEELATEERPVARIALERGFSVPVQADLDRDLNNLRGPKVGRTFTRRDTPFTITTAAVGDIEISGTSISSFATRPLINSFNTVYSQITVNVAAETADDAWAAFCAGEVAVIQTNRLPSETELSACSEAGINPYEVYLGSDAVVFLVKSDAGLPQCIDYSHLADMLVPIPNEGTSDDSGSDSEETSDEATDEAESSESDESRDEASADDSEADESVDDAEDVVEDDENATSDTVSEDVAETSDEIPAAPVQQEQGPTTWNQLDAEWVDLPLIVLVPSIGAAETDVVLGRAAPSARLRRTDRPTVQETPSSSSLDDIVYRLGSTATVEGAITYVTWSTWQTNSDVEGLSILEISNQAGGVGCTPPASETIQDGSYPLGYSSYLFFSEEALSNEVISALLWHTYSTEGLDAVEALNPAGFDRQVFELGRDDLFTLIAAKVPQPEDEAVDGPPTDTETPDGDGTSEPITDILG